MLFLKKLLPILFFGSLFYFVIFYTPYPASWERASTLQILSFFIPLLFLLTFLINFFLNYLPRSFILGCTIMFLLVLYSVYLLNIFTLIIIFALSAISLKYFPKIRYPRFGLTRSLKIPKLSRLGAKKR